MLETLRRGQRWLTGLFVLAVGAVFIFFIGLGGPLAVDMDHGLGRVRSTRRGMPQSWAMIRSAICVVVSRPPASGVRWAGSASTASTAR